MRVPHSDPEWERCLSSLPFCFQEWLRSAVSRDRVRTGSGSDPIKGEDKRKHSRANSSVGSIDPVAAAPGSDTRQLRFYFLAHLRIASAEASISSSVVDQFEMEIRMACMPRHVVPPNQQVPSSCTRRLTPAVN